MEVNGNQDGVREGNEGDGHVYGFSDEDNDWIEDMEGEVMMGVALVLKLWGKMRI